MTSVSAYSRRQMTYVGFILLTFSMAISGLFGTSVSAVGTNDPDASGMYRFLEIAEPNTFRVYARPGETIHFTIEPGERDSSDESVAGLCGEMSIRAGNGDALTGVVKNGVRNDDTTFSGVNASAGASTCGTGSPNVDEPHKTITVSYTVPAGAGVNVNSAYRVSFIGYGDSQKTKYGDDVQGYEWRVAVSTSAASPTTGRQEGRVWFVGDNAGLRVWQDNEQSELQTNATNHSFRFVRADGYRYTMKYTDYQGIWSVFHGGVYGARVLSSPYDIPAYRSYDEDQAEYSYSVLGDNLAYIFVDCGASINCPALTPPGLRETPITEDTSIPAEERNPIEQVNASPTASTGFRYTGYDAANNIAATAVGPPSYPTVWIPYNAMQTGYIRMTVTWEDSMTPLCVKDYFIDNATGFGTLTWRLRQDSSCGTGNTLTTAGPPVIPPTKKLTISVQARHLGEMHFVERDTERRVGIEVTGNGRQVPGAPSDSRKWLSWYDPFSRVESDTCGEIPARIGRVFEGAFDPVTTNMGAVLPQLVASSPDGSLKGGDNDDSNVNLWDSMSSGRTWSGAAISRYAAGNTGQTPNGIERQPVDSTGGVHGWRPEPSLSGCDASGNGAKDGKSKTDGTATTESSWGNDRVIVDWTYAFQDPEPRVLSIGGPSYTLTPSVTPTPSDTASAGETRTFEVRVRNDSAVGSNSAATDWVVRRIIIPAGVSPAVGWDDRTGTDSALFACSYYTSLGATSCTQVDADTRVFNANITVPPVGTGNYAETISLTPGARLCYALMVNSASEQAKPNYREVVNCVIIAKYPGLTVTGGDLRVGGNFDSPCTLPAAPTADPRDPYGVIGHGYGSLARGSYTQYAATTPGLIERFGSQGWPLGTATSKGLLFGTGGFGMPVPPIAYAATSHGYFLGNYGSLSTATNSYCLPDMKTLYDAAVSVVSIGTASSQSIANVDSLLSGIQKYHFTGSGGTLNLSAAAGSVLSTGKRIVVYVTQNAALPNNNVVRIKGPITYANSYSSLADIPQLVVVADGPIDILFDHATNDVAMTVNGIFSTRGNVYTCRDFNGVASITVATACSGSKLFVNGIVIAGGRVFPFRTAGFNDASAAQNLEFAETFRLSPAALLADYNRASKVNDVTVDYQEELPSRY